MAAGGVGATFRLPLGGTCPTVRSQCELGVTSPGVSGTDSGKRATTSARRRDRDAGGHEVPGAGGAFQPGGLSRAGGCPSPAQVDEPASWAVVCRLATGLSPDATTDSRTTAVVFQSPAGNRTSTAGQLDAGTVARSGNRGGDCPSGQPTAPEGSRRTGSDGGGTERTGARPARSHLRRTSSSGSQNPPGGRVSPIRKGRTC